MPCVSICCVKLLASQSFLTHVFRAIALRLAGNSNAFTLQLINENEEISELVQTADNERETE